MSLVVNSCGSKISFFDSRHLLKCRPSVKSQGVIIHGKSEGSQPTTEIFAVDRFRNRTRTGVSEEVIRNLHQLRGESQMFVIISKMGVSHKRYFTGTRV